MNPAWTSLTPTSTRPCAPPWPPSPGQFGGTYFTEHAERREPTSELWQALAAQGFIGINIPERLRRRRRRAGRAGRGVRGDRRPGLPAAAPAGLQRDQRRDPHPLRQRRSSSRSWLPAMASGDSKVVFAITEPDAGSNTHRLATTATPRRRRVAAQRHQVLHLRGGRGRPRSWSSRAPAPTTATGRAPAVAVPGPGRRRRGWSGSRCRSPRRCRSGSSRCSSTTSGSARTS